MACAKVLWQEVQLNIPGLKDQCCGCVESLGAYSKKAGIVSLEKGRWSWDVLNKTSQWSKAPQPTGEDNFDPAGVPP